MLKNLLELLTPRERNHVFVLLVMILVMAALDALGVAFIMPFMAVLANPELVQTNMILNAAYTALGFTDPKLFLFGLGVFVFFMLVISSTFKALTIYASLRFALLLEYSIGKRMVEGYLLQPYSWFLRRNSADLGKVILSEVSMVIGNCVEPMIRLIAQSAVVIAILLMLLIVDARLALVVGLTFFSAYALIFALTQGFLARVGSARVKANEGRFTAVNEAFGAWKEIKVGGLEQIYIRRFSGPARIYAKSQASASVIRQLPRYALEIIAFGGMLLMTLILMARSNSFASVLPVITLYAFAGYRLLPALQQVYASISQLRFASPALESLYSDFKSLRSPNLIPCEGSIPLGQFISLDQVWYSYPNAPNPALKNVSLTIRIGSMTGFVGPTGSGKTTVVDLILGLLVAQRGTLAIDDLTITESRSPAWRRHIGYVPQYVYLADDTVAGNIAIGLDAQNIDQKAVERAAKVACLHEFVMNELPMQYQTPVGERGISLSGGQCQRIGIARALYHNPQILVLDEATSALDSLTERAIMEAIHGLSQGVTVIVVAHRLGTVKECDNVFLMEAGELRAQGNYETLVRDNECFRAMAAEH